MIIHGIKLRLRTSEGDFGFAVTFSRNLTVIRGNNSSGKSTLYNSVLYGLGMEELVGGRGEKFLPYAVQERFDFDGRTIDVQSSEVLVEIEGADSQIVTLRRAIVDPTRNSKLIEIYEGRQISLDQFSTKARPTYLFDAGSAQREEGFHRFLERFLGFNLPRVPTTTGGEAKLYVQSIFAALAVEQKRGWSDYIANIPFYGIRDAKTRVVEFLLNLGVFEVAAERNRLNSEAVQIATDWDVAIADLRRSVMDTATVVVGVPDKADSDFEGTGVQISKTVGADAVPIFEYTRQLRLEYGLLEERAKQVIGVSASESRGKFDETVGEMQRYTQMYEGLANKKVFLQSSLSEYEQLFSESREDLAKNKAAQKLRTLGAAHDLAIAVGKCPTCAQTVDDSLLEGIIQGPFMDLDENIKYLDRQSKMLERQLAGLRDDLSQVQLSMEDVGQRLSQKREELDAIRLDVANGAVQSRGDIKRQLQIEEEVRQLERAEKAVEGVVSRLVAICERLAANQLERRKLPKATYSAEDEAKVALFEKIFRANASAFGYESANIEEIVINRDTLSPFLANLELKTFTDRRNREIKIDSSASDFVRLIWSYLLGLYQTSSHSALGGGNHPGILMFDEPGQHSMAVQSQHALLQLLAGERGLQSIVAASFDQSDVVFQQATANVEFKLIDWSAKSIQKM